MHKCAIIGAGGIAPTHVEAYLSQKDRCKVVALADPNTKRAKELAEKYKLEAVVYDDYRKMLLDDIDFVSICTPPSLHCSMTLDCLAAGKHVLLEKPMAPSLEECDLMISAAKNAGKILSVVSQYRYMTPYYRLKKLLDSGQAGKPLHISVDALFWRGQPYYYMDWRGRWSTEGGGCTLNHAVHFIDLMLWLCGKPQQVAAFIGNSFHTNSEVEDISDAVLSYESGMVGRLTGSIIHHGENRCVRVDTDKCAIEIPQKIWASKTMDNGFGQDDLETTQEMEQAFEAIAPPALTGHAGQISDIFDAIEGKPSHYTTGEEGRDTLELILAIYKAASTKTVVGFPIENSDDFYRKETMLKRVPIFFEKTITKEISTDTAITLGGDEFGKR